MSAERNLQIVQDIYAAFTRGDLAFVLDRVHPECEAFSVISDAPTGVAWHRHDRGRDGAKQFFDALLGAIEFRVFAPRDFAAMGDHVYITLHMECVIRATGAPLVLDECIHHFTFKDGRAVRWRASEDTACTAAAFKKM
jgi:uncharacterized protein